MTDTIKNKTKARKKTPTNKQLRQNRFRFVLRGSVRRLLRRQQTGSNSVRIDFVLGRAATGCSSQTCRQRDPLLLRSVPAALRGDESRRARRGDRPKGTNTCVDSSRSSESKFLQKLDWTASRRQESVSAAKRSLGLNFMGTFFFLWSSTSSPDVSEAPTVQRWGALLATVICAWMNKMSVPQLVGRRCGRCQGF